MTINFNPVISNTVNNLGRGILKPDNKRNYTLYNTNRVDYLARCGNAALPYIADYLDKERDENQVFEALCVIDKMADYKVPELYKIYPVLSKYNDTDSPEIQVMLSGIYRKTLVPDAFGPLCKMLYKQITIGKSEYFDPTEETGGAILEYIRAYGTEKNNPSAFPAQNYYGINPTSFYQVPQSVIISGYMPYNANDLNTNSY